MSLSSKNNPWTFKEKLVELIFSFFGFVYWFPFFAKRSFWEEWGVTDSGESFMNGGMELVPASFYNAMSSHNLTAWNVVLNVGLLFVYSLIGMGVLHGVCRLTRNFLKN